MSDSFNAHELLSKLRAKSSNSTAASVVSEPPKRGNVVPDFDQKPSPVKTPAAVTTNIRAPISLTLTPSQRQENLNARLELEREIKRLQDEVTSLLSENLQLKQDKEDVEQQFIEFRTKSEKTITDLRGRIAANTLHNDTQPDRGTGAGRLYGQRSNDPQSGSKLSTSQLRSPSMKSSNKHLTTPQSGSHSQHHHNNNSWYEDNNSIPPPPPSSSLSNTHPQGGFRDPTFSELMRRSTPEHHDFRTALRRENNTKLGTGLASAPAPLPPHTHQSPHFTQPGGSSQHAGGASAQHTTTAHAVNNHSGGGSGHAQHGLHMSGHSQQSHQHQQQASHGHSHNTTVSGSNVPHTHSNSTGQRTKSVPNISVGMGNQQYHYTDGPHGESKTNSANPAHSSSESHRHSADMEHFMTANMHHHPGGNLGMAHLTTGTHHTNSNNNVTTQGNSNTTAAATAGNSSNHHHTNHHGIVRTVDNCSDEDDDLPVLEIDLSA